MKWVFALLLVQCSGVHLAAEQKEHAFLAAHKTAAHVATKHLAPDAKLEFDDAMEATVALADDEAKADAADSADGEDADAAVDGQGEEGGDDDTVQEAEADSQADSQQEQEDVKDGEEDEVEGEVQDDSEDAADRKSVV